MVVAFRVLPGVFLSGEEVLERIANLAEVVPYHSIHALAVSEITDRVLDAALAHGGVVYDDVTSAEKLSVHDVVAVPAMRIVEA